MQLKPFLQDLGISPGPQESESLSFEHLTMDSRRVKRGSLYFLRSHLPLEQQKVFVDQAFENGAVALFYEDKKQEVLVPKSLRSFLIDDVLGGFSRGLQLFYKESFSQLKIYGVTGTNGKTSFSYMLWNLFRAYGEDIGVFGTIGNFYKNHKLETGLTSPVAEDFYEFNHQNFLRGMRTAVCEVSSHALDQKRLSLNFLSGGAFTSFSQDHLDYHKDMQSYFEAKKKMLTESLKKGAFFVAPKDFQKDFDFYPASLFLNQGDYSFKAQALGEGVFSYEFSKKEKSIKGTLPFVGYYNALNFSLALAVFCEHMGKEFFPDQRIFESYRAVPGRMESFHFKEKILAYVDYSHTPDSLEKAVEALKATHQKVITVFGCGGDRDQAKRPLMARAAEKKSFFSIVTNDNPRNEEPEKIVSDILKGFNGANFKTIYDRKKAIGFALDKALEDDAVVLVAGKGHEKTQEIKGKKYEFSDQAVIREWVEKNGS